MKKPGFMKKSLKRIVYETRGINPKTLISLMLVGGILFSLFYSVNFVYTDYASSSAKVDLFYQEIADAQYPDKSRFTYYDLIDEARIDEALKKMQEKGVYTNFTAEQLQDEFSIYSYLDSSVRDAVDSARSEGSNYSYVANEYSVTFYQPHDYKDKNVLKKLFGKDYSDEFLTALMDVNYEYFVEKYGGQGGFESLTDMGDLSCYDYDEKIDVYNLRITGIINSLNSLTLKSDNFVSPVHNRTIKDLVEEYKLLKSQLNTISNFVTSSGITRDVEVSTNKLNTNLEMTQLKFKKSSDLYEINKYAQSAYDHTFTENLIVVALDDREGLYQARPKTAFDSVVDQKHEAMEDKAYYTSEVEDITKTILKNEETTHSGKSYERLCEKCEEYLGKFDSDYEALCNMASEVLGEYYDVKNKGFMHYSVEKKNLFDMSFLTKCAVMFVMGSVFAFVLCVLFNSYQEYAKIRKKRKIVRALHSEL